MIDPSMRNRTVYSGLRSARSDQKLATFPAPHLGAATLLIKPHKLIYAAKFF